MTEAPRTSDRPAPAMPAFAAFYRAVNADPERQRHRRGRRDPFPWQAKLADRLAGGGAWPAVGIPTGLGKTACLDVAVWWLASQADRKPAERTAPTRIWWVVNRRLLVDSTSKHAEEIARALSDPGKQGLTGQEAEDVAAVADRLRSLSADPNAEPLEVIRLRGGVSSSTPTDPSQPAVVLCTLLMYGSRLLFRGYGSTRKLRPIDAAMAGADSLVLLDEAHLAPHLRALLPALADCTPGAQSILPHARSRPTVVTLTATGDERHTVDLDDDDKANPVVRQRLDAAKPVTLRIETGDVAQRLAEATLELIEDASSPAACIVFANTPGTARKTFERLKKRVAGSSPELLLLTGRSREREAERIRDRILDPADGMASERDATVARQRHLIVVATQTLEVGADVDAERLVTEACGVRALTQRLGRLNRLGRHPHARAVYVHLPPARRSKGSRRTDADSDEWPVYGSEPLRVLERLEAGRRSQGTETVNLSPRHVAEILGAPGDDPGRAPEVLPGLLWEWTKTTTPPPGEAPVEPYFSGIAGPEYAVSLIWRAHVPDDGEQLWPRASDREAVDVPIHEVRDPFRDEEDLCRLSSDGVTTERISLDDLRPGDTVVVPSDRGLLDEFGWNPAATSPVVDASLGRHGLPLDPTALRRLCNVSVGRLLDTALGVADDDEDVDPTERAEAVEQILAAVANAPTPTGWSEVEWQTFASDLRPPVVTARNEVPRLLVADPATEPRSDELDETSLAETAVDLDLDLHCQAVGTRAGSIATRIGLPDDLVQVVERAGRLHDVGKADRRFQRWLDPGGARNGQAAKSNMPRHQWNAARSAAGWPRGGRHEELSARLVLRWLEQFPAWEEQDLLVHLVISHHGKGRPLVPPPPVADGTPEAVSTVVEGATLTAPADLSIVDWNQPARFRRLNDRFGPWGLALLEAIVVRADHAVSAGADRRPVEVR